MTMKEKSKNNGFLFDFCIILCYNSAINRGGSMEARLVIALDEQCQLHRTLKTMELKDLDSYMVKNFENSTDVRNYPEFQSKIEQFLTENQNYRNQCARQNNGYIRLVYTDETGQFRYLKSYYKKDKNKLNTKQVKANLKRQITQDTQLLKKVMKDYKSNMTYYCQNQINYGLRLKYPTYYTYAIGRWIEAMSTGNDGYFRIRQLNRYVEKYHEEQERKNKGMKISSGTIRNVNPDTFKEDLDLVKEDNITRCIKQAEDPDELFATFDLDELNSIDLDEYPSFVKKKKDN